MDVEYGIVIGFVSFFVVLIVFNRRKRRNGRDADDR